MRFLLKSPVASLAGTEGETIHCSSFLMTRVSNFFFDVMVVAGIAAISLGLLENYWGIIIILAIVGMGSTFLYERFVAKKLGMWGVGIGSDEGRIVMKTKTRGASRVINAIIEDMRERGFRAREIVISHCHNSALAEKLRERVLEVWSNAKITILKTRGLDSFYAERGGLIVAYN